MARTTLTPIAVPAAYAAAPVIVTWTACDPANLNQFVGTGREIMLVWNSGAATHIAQLTSIADPYGRTGDIIWTVAIGGYVTFFITPLTGFLQADGFIYCGGNHADLKFAILRLP